MHYVIASSKQAAATAASSLGIDLANPRAALVLDTDRPDGSSRLRGRVLREGDSLVFCSNWSLGRFATDVLNEVKRLEQSTDVRVDRFYA